MERAEQNFMSKVFVFFSQCDITRRARRAHSFFMCIITYTRMDRIEHIMIDLTLRSYLLPADGNIHNT